MTKLSKRISLTLPVLFLMLGTAALQSQVARADGVPGISAASSYANLVSAGGGPVTDQSFTGDFVFSSTSYSGNGASAQANSNATWTGGDAYASASETNGSYISATATVQFGNESEEPGCSNPTFDGVGWSCGYTESLHVWAHPTDPSSITRTGDAAAGGSVSVFGGVIGGTPMLGTFDLDGTQQNWYFTLPLYMELTEGIQVTAVDTSAEVYANAGANGFPGSATTDYSGTFGEYVDVYDATGNLIDQFGTPPPTTAPEPSCLLMLCTGLLVLIGATALRGIHLA